MRGRLRRRQAAPLLLAVAAGVLAPSVWVSATTDASFTALETTSTSWSAGSVVLTDDDADHALFSVSGLIPGESASRCLTAAYTGTLPAQVRLTGTSGGTGLAGYLDLQVTRGRFSGASAPDCTGFVPDVPAYLGPGHAPGVVLDAPLTALPTTWGTSTADPYGTGIGRWLPGESHAYRFTLVLRGDDAAAGLGTTADFVLTARDSTPPELDSGETLQNLTSLRTVSGSWAYHVDLQTDGNLVVYDNTCRPIWATGTYTEGATVTLRLRPDGDLVLEKPGVATPVWGSGSAGSGADHLVLRDDGVLDLRRADGTSVWTSTSTAPGWATQCAAPSP